MTGSLAIKALTGQDAIPIFYISWAGVKLAVKLSKVFLVYMGIELGGADIDVSQHCLDEPEVSPPFQKMGGKGVP